MQRRDAITLRRMTCRDDGAVAITVAILLVVFLGFAAIAVDVGSWYSVRRQLQAAADAAALAGVQELILEKSDPEVWDTVEEYVGLNTEAPIDDEVSVVPYSPGGLSEITDESVKVTLAVPARTFFGVVLGRTETTIRAQARAVISYASEGKGLVPLSVPIILSGPETRAEVTVSDGKSESSGTLGSVSDSEYAGSVSFAAAVGANETKSLTVHVDMYNSEGVLAAELYAIDRIIVAGSSAKILDVWFDPGWVSAGGTTQLKVKTSPDVTDVKAKVNKTNLSLADPDKDNVWVATVTLPSGVEPYAVYEATEIVASVGKTAYQLSGGKNAVGDVVVARRSNSPVTHVSVSPGAFSGSGPKSTTVSVVLQRFGISDETNYNDHQYVLKVDAGGGASAGNFGMVDFRKVYEPPYPPYANERTQSLSSMKGNWYEYAIGNGWPSPIFVNDALQTYTGGSVGSTDNGFTDRFGGESADVGAWFAAGKPYSPHILYVPIIEKLEEYSGRTYVKVVAFASFFVEEYDKGDDLLVGHFVEYVAASSGTTSDPGPYALETPRLTSEGLDF